MLIFIELEELTYRQLGYILEYISKDETDSAEFIEEILRYGISEQTLNEAIIDNPIDVESIFAIVCNQLTINTIKVNVFII